MMRRTPFFLLVLTLAGCTARMVSAPGSAGAVANAPINEASRPGMVSYLNQGLPAIRERRRASAYRQMAEACGGKYRIDREGPRAEGGAVVEVAPGSTMYADSQYWYIQFSCVRD